MEKRDVTRCIYLILMICLLSNLSAQQVQFINHMDRSDISLPMNSATGSSVAIDGDYAVVGIPAGKASLDIALGMAIIYKYDAVTDNWAELKTLVGSQSCDDATFGFDVEIYGDLIAVSEFKDKHNSNNLSDPGKVYIYQRDLGGVDNWGELKIVDAPNVSNSSFGYGLALNDSTLVVTHRAFSVIAIYDRDNGGQDNWGLSQSFSVQAFLMSPNIKIIGDRLFHSVFGEGTFIRERNEGGINNWGLVKTIIHNMDFSGAGLEVKDSLLFIGTGQAIQVHKKDEGGIDNWGLIQSISSGGNTGFGREIHISDTLMIAAEPNASIDGLTRAGRARILTFDPLDSNPITLFDTIIADNPKQDQFFGMTVDIQGDQVIIGATKYPIFFEDDRKGKAEVRSRDEGGLNNWGIVLNVENSPNGDQSQYGRNIDVVGNLMLTGVQEADTDSTTNSGAAFLYHKDQGGANTWGEIKYFTAPHVRNNENFGKQVALSSDIIAIGENGDTYVYYKDEGGLDNWGLVKTIQQNTQLIDIHGDVLVIISPNNEIRLYYKDQGGIDNWGFVTTTTAGLVIPKSITLTDEDLYISDPQGQDGRVFHFKKDEGGVDNWGLKQVIFGSLPFNGASDDFGSDIAIFDSLLVVTSQNGSSGGAQRVFVFEEEQSGYNETQILERPQFRSTYARNVAMTDRYVITGDRRINGDRGRAYLYQRDKGGFDKWGLVETFDSPNPCAIASFGSEFGIVNKTVFIASFNGHSHGFRSGSILRYEIKPVPFITEWNIQSGESITIPTNSQPYRFEYRWVLTSDTTVVIEGNHFSLKDGDFTTTFAQGGIYRLEIDGLFPHLVDYPVNKLLNVVQWGEHEFFSMKSSFQGWAGTGFTATDTPDLRFTHDFSSAFANTPNFNHDISNWDMSQATNLDSMFAGAQSFNQDISGWKVDSVQTMASMFRDADAFDQPIGAWKVQHVSSFDNLFRDNDAINQDLGNWMFDKTDSVVNVFLGATGFDCEQWSKTIIGWEENNGNVNNVGIGGPNASYDEGAGIARLKLLNRGWTINGTEISGNCRPFITSWTMNDNDILFIGLGASGVNFNYIWINESTNDTFSVGSISSQFDTVFVTVFPTGGQYQLQILGSLPLMQSFDRNKLTDVVQWGGNVWTKLTGLFQNWPGTDFSATDTPNLSQVTSIDNLFQNASNFNDDLDHWDVSTIRDMRFVFAGCTSFNGDISTWDVSEVRSMRNMFAGASAFNQDLSSWRFSFSVNLDDLFRDATGMDCSNWSNTIIAWNYFHPDLTNQSLSVAQLTHGIHATASINELNARGWNVASTEDLGACSDPAIKYWTGDVSNDWNTSDNWHNKAVPVIGDDVVILNRVNQPILNTITPFIKSMELLYGSILRITPSGNLNLD